MTTISAQQYNELPEDEKVFWKREDAGVRPYRAHYTPVTISLKEALDVLEKFKAKTFSLEAKQHLTETIDQLKQLGNK